MSRTPGGATSLKVLGMTRYFKEVGLPFQWSVLAVDRQNCSTFPPVMTKMSMSGGVVLAGQAKDSNRPHTLFVYGTLKNGFPNHRFLGNARFLGYGKTVEPYALYMDEHPLVYARERVGPVHGEVYKVSDDTLDRVDGVQGHPKHYYREEVEVCLESGEHVTTWIYFFPDKLGKLIESGVFDLAEVLA